MVKGYQKQSDGTFLHTISNPEIDIGFVFKEIKQSERFFRLAGYLIPVGSRLSPVPVYRDLRGVAYINGTRCHELDKENISEMKK